MQGTDALTELGRSLAAAGYAFVTPTPATHARVLARDGERAGSQGGLELLRDVFGWSRSFQAAQLPGTVLALLERGDGLERLPEGRLRSRFRFSSLEGRLHVHSAFPTQAADSVFLGPDTYRFVRFLLAHADAKPGRVVDVGAGSGAGGLALADRASGLVLADVNPAALICSAVNAGLHGARVQLQQSDLLAQVEGPIQLAMMNPPYLVDSAARTYRDGGGTDGTALAVRFVREGLQRVEPGGQLILYTGAPIRRGRDLLREALEPLLAPLLEKAFYEEIDPDVFGEELDSPAYADVDRIAAVGLVIRVAGASRRP